MNRRSSYTPPLLPTLTKGFQGTIYYNLENFYTIFYRVNGDFTNNEPTTFTGGGEIGFGENATISFTASYTDGIFEYYYGEHRLNLYPY